MLQGGDRVLGLYAFTQNERAVGFADALPALVAVHGPVAARHRREMRAAGLQSLERFAHEPEPALRIGVAAVHEGVEIHVFNARFARKTHDGEDVFERGVDAPVGEKSHDVEASRLLRGFEHLRDARHPGETAVFNGAVDLDEVLIKDAARSDVEVADFGIPHLTFGKPHGETVGAKGRMGAVVGELRHEGRAHGPDHVGLVAAADAPAVENHEKNFRHEKTPYCVRIIGKGGRIGPPGIAEQS